MISDKNSNSIERSEINNMKDKFDECVKVANMIAIAKMLLRENVIDKSAFNTLVRKIKIPS